jgi:hypothetical protein
MSGLLKNWLDPHADILDDKEEQREKQEPTEDYTYLFDIDGCLRSQNEVFLEELDAELLAEM